MLVSFETRIRLYNTDNECAMLVRRNELTRSGRRLLIPFGGGVVALDRDKAYIKQHYDVTPGADLRFTIPNTNLKPLQNLFKSFSENRWLAEARRQFTQEAGPKAHNFLTLRTISQCKLEYVKSCHFKAPSVRHDTFGQPTQYFIGVLNLIASKSALKTLHDISKQPSAMLEFVPQTAFGKPDIRVTEKKRNPFATIQLYALAQQPVFMAGFLLLGKHSVIINILLYRIF